MKKNIVIATLSIVILAGIGYGVFHRFYTMNNMSYNQTPLEDDKDKYENREDVLNNTMMGGMMMHSNVVSEEQFIRDMIPHHQEAVDTSKEIVTRSQNPALVTLTTNIIDAQTKEIAMMQGWLKDWYPNSTGTSSYKNMMPNLAIVSGASLDRLYLQGMIMHHMGAIQMAEGVLKLNPRKEVVDFANAIIEAQSKEIEIMRSLMMQGAPMMQGRGMMHR